MKKLIVAILLITGCSKTNQTTPTPTTGSYIRVEKADTSNAVMSVTVKIVGASAYKDLKLVIYQNASPTGVDYKYPIAVKDGEQVIDCNKFSDSSPMNYQLQVDGTFSNMMQLTY